VLISPIGTPRSRAITALTIGPHSRPGRARAAADERLNLIGSGRAQPTVRRIWPAVTSSQRRNVLADVSAGLPRAAGEDERRIRRG
jgi:hypothetical protein